MKSTAMTRRDFVRFSTLLSAGLVAGLPVRGLGRSPVGAETFYNWIEVAPGLHAGMGPVGDNMAIVGGNCLLAVGKEDSLLIDTKQAVLGPSLRREALAIAKSIDHVINTHHHFDHAGGNAAFHTGSTVISAHPKCRERIAASSGQMLAQLDQKIAALSGLDGEAAKAAAADAGAFKASLATIDKEAFVPDESIEGGTLRLAGRQVEVTHVGAGHTDNDLILFFPEANVLVAGDLIFNGLHPYFDVSASATSTGWVRSLSRIVGMCDQKTMVVPGHGAMTDIEGVKRQIQYFETLTSAVRKAKEDGKTREEVAAMKLPEHAQLGLKVAEAIVTGGIFDELPGGAESKPAPAPE